MRTKQAGFTLVELMVTVAIIAILAGIAYPNYINHVVKTRRVAAASCLMEHAQFMERYYTTKLSYVAAPAPVTCPDISDSYTIEFTAAPTARAYVLRAVPKGAQSTKDTGCGTLSINQAGVKSISASGGAVSSCW